MKIRTLFNLLSDAQEVAGLFSKVETPEQMVSTLERLKKQGATEFLEAIDALRLSAEATLEDVFEMGGTREEEDDFESSTDGEGNENDDLLSELGVEDENSDTTPEGEENKS